MIGERIERVLFSYRPEEPRVLASLRTAAQLVWLLARDALEGRLNLYAMSLVYSTLIAMVPLLAFGFAALKGLGVRGVLGPTLGHMLSPLGPAGMELSHKLVEFVNNVRTGVLGALGLALLAITAVSLLRKIEAGLNAAWRVEEGRPLLTRAMHYVSLLFVGPIFLFAAFGLTASVTNGGVARYLGDLSPVLPSVLGKLLPYLIVITAFTAINLIAPNIRVKMRAALAAGIAGGIAWQTGGLVFAVLAARSTRLSAVYSSFAILVLFLIWVYISWLILLLGARLGFYVQNPAWRQARAQRGPLGPAAAEAAALEVMLAAAEHFAGARPPLGLGECIGRIGVPALGLQPVLDNLVAAQLLYRIEGRGYALARSPDKIRVAEVIAGARGRAREAPHLPHLDELLGRANSARQDALTSTTLADLARAAPAAGDRPAG